MAIVAVVLVVLLALITLGVLVLPGAAPPPPVKVTEVEFNIVQGTNSSGFGWFGPDYFNYTGLVNGYPFSVTAGDTFSVPVVLENFDNASHTIYSVTVGAPFSLVSTSPGLPSTVPALLDDADIELVVKAPSTAGATLVLFVTINALPPG